VAVDHLQEALDLTGKLPPSDGVRALCGELRSQLGDALRALGRFSEAHSAYVSALKVAEELGDLRAQAVDLGQLGALALAEGRRDEALARCQASLEITQRLKEPRLEAVARHQLGRILQEAGSGDEAARQYREAGRISERVGDRQGAGQSWHQLASLLQTLPGRLIDARSHANEALTIAQSLDPTGPDVWKTYGLLASINEKDAALTADPERKATLQTQAHDYRQLQQYGPRFVASLARLTVPSCGRAVILGRLGWCLHLGGRPDLAMVTLRDALHVVRGLSPALAAGLDVTLYAQLGDVLLAIGNGAEAKQAYEASLRAADSGTTPVMAEAAGDDFSVTIHDQLNTEYAFDPDLLVDGRGEQHVHRLIEPPVPLSDAMRPALNPATRVWLEGDGTVRFRLHPSEPAVERDAGCTIMRRVQRDVVASGHSTALWQLIGALDGKSSVGEIVAAMAPGEPDLSRRMLAALAAAGVVDTSGRSVGRFIHWATRKGVLPAGGLGGNEVLELATDGGYKEHRGAPCIALSGSIPDALRSFHALTRSRRSRRDYNGVPLRRDEFDGLLSTACGITGTMGWAGREVGLRAYPSSGALYAVEIYPVVFRVDDLDPAVYHYRSADNLLEVVKPGLDPTSFARAALPMEREMVAGAAAMICLTGSFVRHERKYGQGGYRMLVAEAGHISQNLVLAATALGLSARPFGGVFDDLLNQDLGLDGDDEQFLLGVLIGHAGGT
jgi:SagB-type dehydrogenase family enzyme